MKRTLVCFAQTSPIAPTFLSTSTLANQSRKSLVRIATLVAISLITLVLSVRAHAAARGRVSVVNNSVVTDQRTLLRGGSLWLTSDQIPFLAYYQSDEPWQRAKANHMNAIRIAATYGSPGDTFNIGDYEYYLDMLIDRAATENMYVIIDWHNGTDGTHSMNVSTGQTFWGTIAPRYADRTNVLYELCNEPVAWSVGDYTAQDIQDQQTLYNLMRQNAPATHIIVLSFAVSNPGMENLAKKLNVDWTKTSVGFHGYWQNSSQSISQLKAVYPAIDTEFMPPTSFTDQPHVKPDQDFGMRYMDGQEWQPQTMERLGISWFGWFFLWQPSPLGFEVQATQDALAKNYLWPCDAPMNITNVSSKAPSSFGPFTYQSLYNTYNGTVTVTNTSSSRIIGPLNLVISSLPSGVSVVNATGAYNGKPILGFPYVYTLAPGDSASVNVALSNPNQASIQFNANLYTGIPDVSPCVNNAIGKINIGTINSQSAEAEPSMSQP